MEGVSISTYVRLKPLQRADHGRNRSAMESSSLYGRDVGSLGYSINTVPLNNGGNRRNDQFPRCARGEEGTDDIGETRDVLEISVPDGAGPGLVGSGIYNNSNSSEAVEGAPPVLHFEFDRVFDTDSTQELLFAEVVKSRVLDALHGINCAIFAYGQTGSGKTYTTSGGGTFGERGLIPRVIGFLFECKEARRLPTSPSPPVHSNRKYGSTRSTITGENFDANLDSFYSGVELRLRMRVSFTEIYNEVVYDLLDSTQRDVRCMFLCLHRCLPLSHTHTHTHTHILTRPFNHNFKKHPEYINTCSCPWKIALRCRLWRAQMGGWSCGM